MIVTGSALMTIDDVVCSAIGGWLLGLGGGGPVFGTTRGHSGSVPDVAARPGGGNVQMSGPTATTAGSRR